MNAATILAKASETAILVHIPVTPKKRGRMTRHGARNISWRDNERKMDFPAIPTLWKKFVVTIWNPTIGKNMNMILMPFSAMSISSPSVVNITMKSLGKSSAIRKPNVVTPVAKAIVVTRVLWTLSNFWLRSYTPR